MTYGASPPSSNCRTMTFGIRSLIEAVAFRPIRFFQCSTPRGNIRRKPESSFGENQLLQRSISFSLQPTSHPEMLHNLWVRTSICISTNFILLMGSSPGFGSDTYDFTVHHFRNQTLFTFAYRCTLICKFIYASSQKWCTAGALFTLAFAMAPPERA